MGNTAKIYTIKIEASQAQQQLDAASKQFDDLKNKAAAANKEVKESKEIYQENTAALKDLIREQKSLEAAKKSASGGEASLVANAALDKNIAAQKQLNSIIQESKIDYQGAKEAAENASTAVDKQGATVKQLQASVKEYGAAAAAAALEFGPGTFGALEVEIEQLRASLKDLTPGSKEAAAALQSIAEKKVELDKLGNGINALNPTRKIEAFTAFSNAVTGSFAVATVAAEKFGLSADTAKEYEKKLVSLIAVMNGVEQISRVLTGANLEVLKSTYAAAKGWLGVGEAASTSGKVTRAALLSTGIGALIILVAFLAANFDKVKEVGASIAAKFKPEFDAVSGFIDNVIAKARNLASALSFGLIDDAAKHAQVVAADYRQKELAKQAEHTARLLEIYKARGVDTLALEVDNAKRRLDSLKNSTEEEKKVYADARKDYLVLAAQLEKRGNDEQRASRLAFLNGLAATEQARGADAFKQQLAAKKEQLAQLSAAELAGEYVSAAQKQQLQTELDSLQTTHDTQQAEKRRALLSARLNAELAILQTRGVDGLAQIRTQAQDELTLAQQVNAQQLKIAQQNRANLLAVPQVDKSAVVAAEAEIYKLKLEAGRLYGQQRIVQLQEQGVLEQRVQSAILASVEKREQQHQAILAQAQAAGARVISRVADELAAELVLKQMKLAAQADVAGNLFIRLFGINDAQAQDLKARLADFAQVAGNLVGGLLATAQAAADEQLSAAQTQLQIITEQLSQAQSAADATANQLESASGARRDYLLKKLQAERAETEKLAAAKAKAAKAEEDAEKTKAKLAKESAQLSAAASLASTVATGAKAVEAAVGVIAGGSDLPFPANLVAIGTGLAFVATAVLQAKQLAKSFGGGGELGDGGEIVGGSHASGNDVPVMGGRYRVEGKEMITNVRSTENNRELLHYINREGKNRRLTHADLAEVGNFSVLPHPAGSSYGAGGELGGGRVGSSVSAGSVVVQAQDLSALLDTNRAMLSHLQAINSATDTTAAHTGQLKDYGPPVLEFGYDAELKRQQLAQGINNAEASARL